MTGEAVLLGGISVVITGLLLREVWCFLKWKRSLGRMDRQEWTRLVQILRNK